MIIDSVARLNLTPKYFNISSSEFMSDISGTLQIVTSSSLKIAAGIRATAAFFAPLILIVPVNLFLPFIFICFISTSFQS